jgi:arylsulfatase A-like enzyme
MRCTHPARVQQARQSAWAAVLIGLSVGCSESAVPPGIERAEATSHFPRADARADMLRERDGVERKVSDARDAWTIPVGGSATIELGRYDGPDFATSVALLVPEGGPTTGIVAFEVRVSGPADLEWKTEVDLAWPEATWSEFRIAKPRVVDAGRLEIAAHWVGAAPQGADRVRAAFELPRGARDLPPPRAGAPNVLLVTVDTLRADRLSCYGYPRPTSPHIDALAARGTRFANAYSSAPWTLPSYGSLFTGLFPGEHRAGVVTECDALFGQDQDAPAKTTTELLRADVPTLAERFAAAGFATAMFHANYYLSRASGIERGFQRYVHYGSNARNGVDRVLKWIDEQGTSPWFGVAHLMDPHFPYAPPAPFDREFAGVDVAQLANWPLNLAELRAARPEPEIAKLSSDLYDGEIAFTDQEIGRLLDTLAEKGVLANTIVVLHSDHGEEFWEHGSCDHGHSQHQELLRVPLVIAWPDHVPAGRVVVERVRALDVFATLLELAGIAVPEGVESGSLVPTFREKEAPRRAIAEAIHEGRREIKAVFDGTQKLVQRGTAIQLFDVATDRSESVDLAGRETQRVEELRALLLQHHVVTREAAKHARALLLREEARQNLEKVGYTGSDAKPRKE